jgi:hypothetical protein
MWSITDSDAPVVADEVHAQLFKDSDSDPDPTQAAQALDTVKKLIKDSSGTKSCLEWVLLHRNPLRARRISPPRIQGKCIYGTPYSYPERRAYYME